VRNAFADEITRLGAADARVVLLAGDIGNKLFDKFKQQAEGRFLNCGVAEANMISVAAGMALSGLRPITYTITPFTTTRCFEQIRVGVAYHEAPVIVVGTGAGLSYAELGPTHHSLEDFALLRALPGMIVFAPCDATELRLGLRAALKQDSPVYMRIGKKGEPAIHAEPPPFEFGRAITVRQGDDACIINTGTTMAVALGAADRLAAEGISTRVESFHTVKPLDTTRLEELFARYRIVAVVEEHQRAGGLGGSIAEWLAAQDGLTGRLVGFGTDDVFMHDVGSQDYARAKFGLTPQHIATVITARLAGFAAGLRR
jgi:transketolase